MMNSPKTSLIELRKNKAKLEKYSKALSSFFSPQLIQLLNRETDRESLQMIESTIGLILESAKAQIDSEILHSLLINMKSADDTSKDDTVVDLREEIHSQRSSG